MTREKISIAMVIIGMTLLIIGFGLVMSYPLMSVEAKQTITKEVVSSCIGFGFILSIFPVVLQK